MKIKYEAPYTGMHPKCKYRPTVCVGSLACRNCAFHKSHTCDFVRKEMHHSGKKLDVYGGEVDCLYDSMKKPHVKFGIEFKISAQDVWHKASLTMICSIIENYSLVKKAIKDNAMLLQDQENWYLYRITESEVKNEY